MKTQSPVRTLAQAGLIAAMYAALTLLLPAPSFGIGQCLSLIHISPKACTG